MTRQAVRFDFDRNTLRYIFMKEIMGKPKVRDKDGWEMEISVQNLRELFAESVQINLYVPRSGRRQENIEYLLIRELLIFLNVCHSFMQDVHQDCRFSQSITLPIKRLQRRLAEGLPFVFVDGIGFHTFD